MGGPSGKPEPQAHHRLILSPPQHYPSGMLSVQQKPHCTPTLLSQLLGFMLLHITTIQ